MNKIYGGFVSNPVNKKDMTDRGDITRTFGGNIVISYSNIMPTYTAPTAKTNLEYTGEAQELVNPGSSKDGIIKYSLDNSTWSTNIPTGTAAQTYTVYWKLEGNTGFEDVSSSSISVSIAAAKELVLQVFRNSACTQPPVPGDNIVYVKLYVDGDQLSTINYPSSPESNALLVYGPDEESPTEDFTIQLWVDSYNSEDHINTPFLRGDIVELRFFGDMHVDAGFNTKFYSDGTSDTPVEELPE